MSMRHWLIVSLFLIGVTWAWNSFWGAVVVTMEDGLSPTPMLSALTIGLGALTLMIIVAALTSHARSPNKTPPSRSECAGFAAIISIAAVVSYLLWVWIRVPEEVSHALSVMSVFGWGIVAIPTCFVIGIVGLHLLSRKKLT